MAPTHRFSASKIEELLARIVLTADPHDSKPLHAPFDNTVLCNIPQGSEADVEKAVAQAKRAQPRWAATPVEVRADLLKRLHDLIYDRREELMDIVQMESGKARRHAFEEVADCMLVARYYAFHGPKMLRPERRRGVISYVSRAEVRHLPLGVVGFIVPWNYPLTLAMTDMIPALLAGNAVVVKPASLTPLTALYVARLFEKAGLPRGLFNVVTGSGRGVGEPLIDRVDYVQFTGSTEVGRGVAGRAGARLIGSSMELGGKNPMLILPDANLKLAVDTALRACYANTGQLCVSIERIYVHESLYTRFVETFGKRVSRMKLGAGYDLAPEVGSLIDDSQLDTVRRHVDDAVAKGAKLVAGGKARPDLGPFFFEPTVLTNVVEDMTLFNEETFGPVVSIYPYRDLHDAISLANAGPYGLNASIITRSSKEAARIAPMLRFGTVSHNEAYGASWGATDAPMGGMKESGLGRRHGKEGLLKYTEAQTLAYRPLIPIAAPGWLSQGRFQALLFGALRLLKKVPGLR